MAQQAAEQIAANFMAGMQLKEREKEHQDAAQAAADAREIQQEQFEKQLEAQKKANQAMLDIRHAELDHASAQTDLANLSLAQRTGMSLPGYQISPGLGQTSGVPATNLQLGPNGELIPSQGKQGPLVLQGAGLERTMQGNPQTGSILTAPTLAESPEQQLIRQQATDVEASRIRQEQARYASELAMHQAEASQQHKDYLEIMGRTEKFQNDQRVATEKFQKKLKDDALNMQLQIAGMRAGTLGAWGGRMTTDADGNPTYVPNDPTKIIGSAVDDGTNLRMSLEQAKKEFNPKQFAQIDAAIRNKGDTFANQKQIDKMHELEGVAPLVDTMYQLFKERLDHPLLLQMGTGAEVEKFNRLKEELGGKIASVAGVLRGIKRYNGMEVNDIKKALTPSTDLWGHSGKEEFKKYENFTQELQDLFNTQMSGLPEGQKNQVRQNIGYNNFPYLGSVVHTPGAPVTSIAGSAKPGVNVPGANVPGQPKPGQIWVTKKATGEGGWLSPQYFDPKTYEKTKPPGVQ